MAAAKENPFAKKSKDRKESQEALIDKAKENKAKSKPQKKEVVLNNNGTEKVLTKNGKYVGRPKTKNEPQKTINISVPVSLMEKVEVAKCKYNNNLTEYINAIIRADIETNMDKYNQLYELLNN